MSELELAGQGEQDCEAQDFNHLYLILSTPLYAQHKR